MLVATSTAGTQVGDRMDPAVQAETSIAKRSVSPPPKKRRKKKEKKEKENVVAQIPRWKKKWKEQRLTTEHQSYERSFQEKKKAKSKVEIEYSNMLYRVWQ